MLFSELNDSKNEAFSKLFTYAAELNIAVSFNIMYILKHRIPRVTIKKNKCITLKL